MAAIRYDTPAGEQIRAFGDELTIGRDGANSLPLTDQPSVSRRHARITGSPTSGYVLEDLVSRNGTSIEREGVIERVDRSAQLAHGDVILLGSVRLVFDSTIAASSDQDETPAPAEAAAFSPGETVIGGFPSPRILAADLEPAEPGAPVPRPAVFQPAPAARAGPDPRLILAGVVVVVVVVVAVALLFR